MRSFIVLIAVIAIAFGQAPCDTCDNLLNELSTSVDICGVGGIFNYHANDFNLVALGYTGGSGTVFGDVVAVGGGDVEGRVLASGDLNLGGAGNPGYSIGDKIVNFPANAPFSQKAYSAVVGGNVIWINGQLNPVNNDSTHIIENGIYFPGQTSVAPSWLRFSQCSTGNPLDLTAFRQALQDLSTSYSTAPATASYSIINGGQTIALNGAGQNVCDYLVRINASDWSAHKDFLLQNGWNVGANVVIDIVCDSNPDVFMDDGEFPGLASNIVYNFGPSCLDKTIQATSVTGTILAPWSHLNQFDGRILGNVYVGNVINFLQINIVPCPPNPGSCDCCELCVISKAESSKCGLLNTMKNKH